MELSSNMLYYDRKGRIGQNVHIALRREPDFKHGSTITGVAQQHHLYQETLLLVQDPENVNRRKRWLSGAWQRIF